MDLHDVRKWHNLKTDPVPFVLVDQGLKTCEVRLNDRDFRVGDGLVLQQTRYCAAEMRTMGAPLEYTGQVQKVIVTHVLSGYGLLDGWVALSIHKPEWLAS